jgi:AcrR family transcriptional regulator
VSKKAGKAGDGGPLSSTAWRPPPSRHEQILAAAAELLRNRSYHAVAIDEIGEAAGITGPAVYRHFKSKSDILLALLVGVTEHLYEAAKSALEEGDPEAALSELIRFQIDFALSERTLLAIYIQERHTLPRGQTRPLRRLQHEYLSCWDQAVTALRPDLNQTEVAATVRCVVEMINSVVFYDHPLEDEKLAGLLHALARRALVPDAAGVR